MNTTLNKPVNLTNISVALGLSALAAYVAQVISGYIVGAATIYIVLPLSLIASLISVAAIAKNEPNHKYAYVVMYSAGSFVAAAIILFIFVKTF